MHNDRYEACRHDYIAKMPPDVNNRDPQKVGRTTCASRDKRRTSDIFLWRSMHLDIEPTCDHGLAHFDV